MNHIVSMAMAVISLATVGYSMASFESTRRSFERPRTRLLILVYFLSLAAFFVCIFLVYVHGRQEIFIVYVHGRQEIFFHCFFCTKLENAWWLT